MTSPVSVLGLNMLVGALSAMLGALTLRLAATQALSALSPALNGSAFGVLDALVMPLLSAGVVAFVFAVWFWPRGGTLLALRLTSAATCVDVPELRALLQVNLSLLVLLTLAGNLLL